MLEGNSQFGALAQELFVAAEQTHLVAYSSELTFMEVLAHPGMSEEVAARARNSLEELGITFQPLTRQVLLEAAKLRRGQGLGALDSIHVASALLAGCADFVTNDKELLKCQVEQIRLVPLINAREAILFPTGTNRVEP